MKNIKKSLALLLAFVFVLGICTVGAGAASFNDASSITPAYATAVNVMAGMGILEGSDDDGDGKFDFNPAGNVTRAQAAKIISYVTLGKKAAESLPVGAVFDIKATDWQSKYVKYLSKQGVINGYSATDFGSNDPVTANQFAKMLLTACGYGKAGEYVGDGWDVNVFVDATSLDIFKYCDITDYDAALSRELACQMAYNVMMNVGQVKYTEENGYTPITVKVGSSDVAKTFGIAKYNAAAITGLIIGCKEAGDDYTLFLENDKTTSIKLNVDVSKDKIGHEVTVFYNTVAKYDKNNAVYYDVYYLNDLSTEVSPYFTTYKSMYTNLGGKNMAYGTNFKYWLNNEDVSGELYTADDSYGSTTNTYAEFITATYSKANLAANPTSYFMEKGVFVLGFGGKIVGYKISDYYITKVSKIVTTAGSESITLADNLTNDASITLSNTADSDEVAEYEGVAKGDIVAVSVVGGVYYLTKCQLVENVYISSLGTSAYQNINGTYDKDYKRIYCENTTVELGGTYNLYINNNRWVYAVKVESADSTGLFLVTCYSVTSTTYGSAVTEYYAQMVDSNGAEKIVLINKASYDKFNPTNGTETGKYTGTFSISTYSVSGDKVTYSLNPLTTTPSTSNLYYATKFTTCNGVAGNYYINSDCKYVYVTGSENTLKTVVATSQTNTNMYASYNCYFDPVRVGDTGNNYTVGLVFVAATAPEAAGTSYIYSVQKDSTGFYTSAITSIKRDNTGNSVYYLTTYIDGESKEIPLKGVPDTSSSGIFYRSSSGTIYLKYGFYSYTTDSNGYYTLTDFVSNYSYAACESQTITNIYNGKISTTTPSGSSFTFSDITASDAKFVDITGNSIQTFDDLLNKWSDGYTITVSFNASLLYGVVPTSTSVVYVVGCTKVN